MKKPNQNFPLWETLVMVGSFILLWVWLIAHQGARNSGGQLGPIWTVVQAVSLIALVVVTVRRLMRVRRALRGEDDDDNPTSSQFPPLNGHTRR